MNRIIRLWNQNRKQIIIIGLAVVFFIILIQVLNQMAKEQKRQSNLNYNNTNNGKIETIEELPTESIISDKTTTEEVAKNNANIIDTFINNCNNGNVEEAYNLLTDKCKEILFPTKEIFESNYYNIVFSTKRIYNIKNWISASKSNTYLVEYFADVMSTGKMSEEIDYQDYITISNKDNNKININSFIGYEEINKTVENDKIKIRVLTKEIYKEFEQYKIEIENKTDKRILLDTKNDTSTTYIENSRGAKYSAILSDLSDIQLIMEDESKEIYNIKFNKIYNPSVDIESINFTDIVEDYDLYTQDEENNKERIRIKVEI